MFTKVIENAVMQIIKHPAPNCDIMDIEKTSSISRINLKLIGQ